MREGEWQKVRNPRRIAGGSSRFRSDSGRFLHSRGFQSMSRPLPRDFSSRKVYFEDFPNGMDNDSMKKIFSRYGVHGWVYVAKKRNLRNLNFGFLTVEGSKSVDEAISRLNNITIGPARLRAARARFSAPRKFPEQIIPDLKLPRPAVKPKRNFRDSMRDNRSFSDVVVSKVKPIVNSKVSEVKATTRSSGKVAKSVSMAVPAANGESFENSLVVKPAIWKSRACRVRVSNIASIRNIYDILREYGFQVDFAAPCGDDSVIVAFESTECLENFMNDEWRALNHVLASVDSIMTDYAPTDCLVYIDLMGIPPMVICEEVVRDLASRYGRVVAVDSDLSRPDRLDVVSCLVSVPIGTEQRRISVTWRNKEFNVHSAIRQGVGCDHCNNQYEESSEEGSDSDNSYVSRSEDGADSGFEKEDRREVESDEIEAVNRSNTATPSNSASSNLRNRDNLIIHEEVENQPENDEMLTFKVGERLGLFKEQNANVVMGLLGGKR